MSTTKEDAAAANILKRAELARISRQLKSRLSRTNIKVKDRAPVASSASIITSISPIKKQVSQQKFSHPTTPRRPNTQQQPRVTPVTKKPSFDSIDLNQTEDEADHHQYQHRELPPSSPAYDQFAIPLHPPSTPPHQKTSLAIELYNTASTNKTLPNSSSPARPTPKTNPTTAVVPSTPDHRITNIHDEGADLLMFLATSPSPVQYKQPPSTPSRVSKFNNAPSSSIQRSLGGSLGVGAASVTPGTPIRNLLKTPGFNMNDYVNIYTPSPGGVQGMGGPSAMVGRTPEQFSKDVNGKLIKF